MSFDRISWDNVWVLTLLFILHSFFTGKTIFIKTIDKRVWLIRHIGKTC